MTNDELREDFEDFYLKKYGVVLISSSMFDVEETYATDWHDKMFEAYKAAYASQQARIDQLEGVAEDLNTYMQIVKDLTDENVEFCNTIESQSNKISELEAKLAEVSKDAEIVEAAKNLVRVKGRHNSEIAMNRLIEAIKKDKQCDTK